MTKKRLLAAAFALLVLAACGKKEIPTGPGPEAGAGTSAPGVQEHTPLVQPAPAPEGGRVETVPPFTEEALEIPENPDESWVEAHRAELELYGRSTRPFKAIFFDFDSFEIRADMRERLRENARYLLAHPGVRVELQGNCDERGSSEYNLALGERRALAVKRYLVNLGVEPERLTTVSFGEERPLDPGHNERAWALNRRVDLVVLP